MTQALYRKWRPRKWDQVVAQDHVVQTLRNAIKAEKVGHAYLFSGPRGTGKTTTARLLAKAVNCLSPDLANRPCDQCANCLAVNEGRFMDMIEIDAASNTSVEDIRDLRDRINYSPTEGKFKVYIIDEVHMLSTAAFNALLKTLEEPPPHAIFILATTEVHKIPATVLSRCQRYEFRRIPVVEIVKALQGICAQEDIQADEEALLLIARQSTGALRDAISLLDQLASTDRYINLELAQVVLGTATNQLVLELVEALLNRDAPSGMATVHKALDSGSDPRQFARQVVEYLRQLLLIQLGNEKAVEATQEIKSRLREHSQRIETSRLMDWIDTFNGAITDLRTTWQPSLALEVAFARCLNGAAVAQTILNESRAFTTTTQTAPQLQSASPSPSILIEREESKKVPNPEENKVEAQSTLEDSEPSQPAQPVEMETENPLSSSEREVTTEEILAVWNQIRTEVKLRLPKTEALLNSQKLIQMKNGTLILGFQSEVVRSKMENPENIELTRRVIYNLLHKDVAIECIVISGKGNGGGVDSSYESDSLVNAAIHLGGKLVHKD